MRPVKTENTIGTSKDKQEKEEITDCVYKILCASGEKCYIVATGRKFDTRLKEHKTEVEAKKLVKLSPETNVHQVLSEQDMSALSSIV